jgi:hypothetical protein
MNALNSDKAFNHPKMPIVMGHPGCNDGTDMPVVPVFPMKALKNFVELLIADSLIFAVTVHIWRSKIGQLVFANVEISTV